jgi:hypothetical protein
MIDGMIEVHEADPELSILLQSKVPHRVGNTVDFSIRNLSLFCKALAKHGGHLTLQAHLLAP